VKDLFLTLFAFIGEHWKEVNSESVYIIDSFPIASCDNIRIKRSRRYQGEDYRGYSASKRRYFYGVRLHLVVTARGEPVEFLLTPGAESDTGALQWYQVDLPAGSKILGDKAFNVYASEADLASIGIELCPLRKKNATRTIPPGESYLRELHRKYIETAGSLITQRFPKTIHAVTAAGFELKIVLFLLAYSFDCLAR
jgi:Transposase DDE domain